MNLGNYRYGSEISVYVIYQVLSEKWLGHWMSNLSRLNAIDPHSLKEHTKIHKIPNFGVNRPNSKQGTAI